MSRYEPHNLRDTIVVAAQEETHVYVGDTGYIVIRQKDSLGSDDAMVFLSPCVVAAIAAKLTELVPQAIEIRNEWVNEAAE